MNDRIQLVINDGIADVRLARPTKLNALDPAMFKAIAEAVAMAIAREITSRSPDAIRAAKRLLNLGTAIDAAALLAAETAVQQRLIGSANQVEAVSQSRESLAPLRGPSTGGRLKPEPSAIRQISKGAR